MSAPPVQVSPLIRTSRWGLLALGITYGYFHNKTVAKWRKEERIHECAARDQYLKEQAEKTERERIEFERTSVLFQK